MGLRDDELGAAVFAMLGSSSQATIHHHPAFMTLPDAVVLLLVALEEGLGFRV